MRARANQHQSEALSHSSADPSLRLSLLLPNLKDQNTGSHPHNNPCLNCTPISLSLKGWPHSKALSHGVPTLVWCSLSLPQLRWSKSPSKPDPRLRLSLPGVPTLVWGSLSPSSTDTGLRLPLYLPLIQVYVSFEAWPQTEALSRWSADTILRLFLAGVLTLFWSSLSIHRWPILGPLSLEHQPSLSQHWHLFEDPACRLWPWLSWLEMH